jgi:hypothetical protein
MKVATVLLSSILLIGCTNSTSDDKDFKNDYKYMDIVTPKKGFYKNFRCVIIREYEKSVFCQIMYHKDFLIMDDWKTRQNFYKSEIVKVEE